ncbi:hypothetical protein [Microbacterium testaceum]|uniref:hypothetical protein n=1 Tax=Microbacterium testaceum TaxID=2033 RepID=UPI001245A1A9|nr:hypothetical protein [Microbacterium testaceum]
MSPLSVGGMTRGARLVVRERPDAALSALVEALRAERFDVGDDRVSRTLSARGSEWIAQDLFIGAPAPTWSSGIVDAALQHTPLAFVPGLRRRATPTVVVASARAHDDGAELVVFSHPTLVGWAISNDAAPLLAAALDRVEAQYAPAGRLVAREALWGIPNDGAPTSQAFVRDELGWR